MKNIYAFDMGRVILRSSNLKWMYHSIVDGNNVKCDYNTFRTLFYDSQESTDVYSGFIDDDTFFKIIREKIGSDKSVNELKSLYIKSKGDVYQDTIDIIKDLKDNSNTVCLLSNLKALDYDYLKSVIDIDMFDKTFLSYLMNAAKPDSKIYKMVIEELGTNNFYFFDDSPINVDSASKLGIKAFTVTGDTINECFSKRMIKKL